MIRLNDALRTARLQLLADAMSGGVLTLYTSPVPAGGGALTTQTALVEVDIPGDLAAADGVLEMILPTAVIAVTGTAAWGRITDANDDFVLDGDCDVLGSGVLFELRTTAMKAGANLTPISTTFTES